MSDQYERLMKAVDEYAAKTTPLPSRRRRIEQIKSKAAVSLEARVLEASARVQEHGRSHDCIDDSYCGIEEELQHDLRALIQQREEG